MLDSMMGALQLAASRPAWAGLWKDASLAYRKFRESHGLIAMEGGRVGTPYTASGVLETATGTITISSSLLFAAA